MKTYNVIFNPKANRGGSLKSLNILTKYFKENNMQYIINTTEEPGHATKIAGEVADKKNQYIVVVGGDGTLFETLNGNNNATIAIIPVGTGNDVALTLGIPKKVRAAASYIKNNKTLAIDYALINNKIKSLSFLSYGISTDIINHMKTIKKNSRLNYFRALLYKMFSFKAKEYSIVVNGKEKLVKADFVSIHNCIYAGGGMQLCKPAVIDDGYLNLLVVTYKSKYRRICNIISILTKRLHSQPNVSITKVKNAKINSTETDEVCCIDGELVNINKMDIQVIHKGLNVFVK